MKNLIRKILKESEFDWTDEANVSWSTYYGEILNDLRGLPSRIDDVDMNVLLPIYYKLDVLTREVKNGSNLRDTSIVDEIHGGVNYIINMINGTSMKHQAQYSKVKDHLLGDITELTRHLKLLGESEFDWVSDEGIEASPNYKGHPQGVVHLRSHSEITEFFDLIKNYGDGFLGKSNRDEEVTRRDFHGAFDEMMDRYESPEWDGYDDWVPAISASFFISKYDPTKYDTGYWDYDVQEDSVEDWLVNQGCEEEVIDCDNWKVYTDISQVRSLLGEKLTESMDWAVEIKPEINFRNLEDQPFIIEWKDGRVVDRGWRIGKVINKNGREYILIKGNKNEPWTRWKLILAFQGKMKKYKFKFKDDEIQRNWTINESNDFEWVSDTMDYISKEEFINCDVCDGDYIKVHDNGGNEVPEGIYELYRNNFNTTRDKILHLVGPMNHPTERVDDWVIYLNDFNDYRYTKESNPNGD